ncbi:transposase [Streptomyces sp. NBC_01794]|uniref:transposase n=1 Tax=Streptomyces sp. NBC_01794 TaxID=2975942 RepID=UPI0038733FF8
MARSCTISRYATSGSAGSSGLRQYAAEHDWLTIVQLPTYAPDLNPVEGIWSLLRRAATANVVFADRDHLVRAVRSGMRRIQRKPHLIDGCLAGTGLSITPSAPPTTQRKGQ